MNARVYANLSTLELTTRLDGSPFTPPVIPALSDIYLRFKLAEMIEDSPALDLRALHSCTARLGWKNEAPTQGDYKLSITHGVTTVETASIAYNATTTVVKAAIDTAIAGIAVIHPCTVTDYQGHYRIVFEDNTQVVTIACTDNGLWPISFCDVDEITWDEGKAWLLQLRQAPVAETSTFATVVPGPPTITEVQAGSTVDGVAINAIQKLFIPPSFAGGSFVIVRDGTKTEPIPVPVQNGATTMAAKLLPLADDGGTVGNFNLTPINNGFYIEFQGEMGGTDQDLMTIEVFEEAPADYLLRLSTRTDAMRTLMLGADADDGEIEIPFNLVLEVADGILALTYEKVIISTAWTFVQTVADDAHNVAADLVWNQPLSKVDNLAHSTDALLIGNRGIEKVIGDGAATSFTINHNLLENSQTFTTDNTTETMTATGHGFADGDPVNVANSGGALPTGLTAGVTYFIRAATANTFQLATTAGGSAINVTTNGTGTNTIVLRDGTSADAVFVQVWNTAGDKEMVSPSDYTVGRPSNNSIEISGFGTTPTSGQYSVLVLTMGRPATYQHHTHPLDDSPETKARIEALEARVTALEALAPSTGILARTTSSLGQIVRALLPVKTLVRGPRTLPTGFVFPETLLDWKPYTLYPSIRASRLLPAVHDAATEAIPAAPLPAPSSSYANRVFTTAADRTDFPGGTLRIGDFAACDGREWHRVVQETAGQSSYYPAAFEIELFRVFVNEYQLTVSSLAELLVGFELAYYPDERNARDRRSAVQWSFKLEFGSPSSDASPGTPGLNLDTFFASPLLALERRLYVTEEASQHRFGAIVERDSGGDLSATVISYLKEVAATNEPASANFGIRGRLCRFDTEDPTLDARGLLAIRGLDVGLDGQPDATLGKLVIS